jgi:hypothetical protein
MKINLQFKLAVTPLILLRVYPEVGYLTQKSDVAVWRPRHHDILTGKLLVDSPGGPDLGIVHN